MPLFETKLEVGLKGGVNILAGFVPTTDLDEIYVSESLIFGSPCINIFKFAVSSVIM